jgi:5-methylthioadenosine/S-adenosylhomocysteine deaminase
VLIGGNVLEIMLAGGTVISRGRDTAVKVMKNVNVNMEDGLIASVGSEKIPSPDLKLDCRGKVLIPTLANAHSHLAMTLLRGVSDNRLLHHWLDEMWNYEKHLTPEHCKAGLLLACLEMIKSGVGIYVDNYFHQREVFDVAIQSGQKAFLGSGIIEVETLVDLVGDVSHQLNEAESLLRMTKNHPRVKGSLCPHTPWTCSRETLEKSADLASRYDALTTIHVSETRDDVINVQSKTGLTPVEYLNDLSILDRAKKLVLAHCVWISGREIQLLGEKNVAVAYCPVSGQKLAYGGVAPVPELIHSGASVCLGTDGPASNNTLDIIREMRTGILLVGNDRWNPEIFNKQQIFDTATFNFVQKFLPSSGMIAKDMKADITVLDFQQPHLFPVHDYLSNLIYCASGQDVDSLFIDGQPLMVNREVLTLDEERIMETARKTVMEIQNTVESEKR